MNKFLLIAGKQIEMSFETFREMIIEDDRKTTHLSIYDVTYHYGGDSDCWHRHSFGKGWIYKNATVDKSAYVGPGTVIAKYAKVKDRSIVYGNARICDHACVSGNSIIGDFTQVCSLSEVMDYAMIIGESYIHGLAKVYGHAKVTDKSRIGGGSRIGGNVVVCGESIIECNRTFDGKMKIKNQKIE